MHASFSLQRRMARSCTFHSNGMTTQYCWPRSKTGAATRILPDLSRISRSQDPRFSPVSRLLEASLDARLEGDQVLSVILTGLGVVALSIACLGVFGVVSYGVTLRLKEIGIRRALGARGSSIVWLLMRQPLLPVILAIVVGMVVGVVAGQNINPHSFDPQPRTLDITLLVGVTLVLIATIGLATLIPALRALRADVVRSLRYE